MPLFFSLLPAAAATGLRLPVELPLPVVPAAVALAKNVVERTVLKESFIVVLVLARIHRGLGWERWLLA